jgi:protein TonB
VLAEPVFSHSAAWPPTGLTALPCEPDDPRPILRHDTLLAEARISTAEWAAGSANLDRPAGEPLQAAKPAGPARRQAWKAAVLVSCLLHAAVALAFLTGVTDSVEIAGADQAGVMMLGNAPDDQSAAGDGLEATNVTLVTMLDPKPVTTVNAEAVPETETLRPVKAAMDAVQESVPLKAVEPELERVAEAAEPVVPPSPGEAIESVAEIAPAPAEPTPDVLAAQATEPAPEVVPRHVESLAETVPSAEAEVSEIEDAPAPSAKPVAEARVTETVQPKKPIQEKPDEGKPGRKTAKKAVKNTSAERTEKPDRARKRAGSGGSNAADSRRGVADGQADGHKEVAGKGGSASAAGNAAASNYPGKVAAKLRRAVRGVSRGRRSGSDVLVSFTVNAGGGLGSVRIARSSGSPELDQAALAIVRRAAPFPPIPAEAGRRSWAFILPLGVR